VELFLTGDSNEPFGIVLDGVYAKDESCAVGEDGSEPRVLLELWVVRTV
jgi:hypothetical protein